MPHAVTDGAFLRCGRLQLASRVTNHVALFLEQASRPGSRCSSGIGSAIARAFVAGGSVVTLTGATAAEAANAAKDTALAAARVEPLDVRDGERVSVFVQDLGELDVVVNCAGVIRRAARNIAPRCSPRSSTRPRRSHASLCRGTWRSRIASRLHRQHGLDAQLLLRRWPRPCLQRNKGGVAQLTKSLRHCLRRRRDPRERHSARVDRHSADAGAAGRCGKIERDPDSDPTWALRAARRHCRAGAFPRKPGGRVHYWRGPACRRRLPDCLTIPEEQT